MPPSRPPEPMGIPERPAAILLGHRRPRPVAVQRATHHPRFDDGLALVHPLLNRHVVHGRGVACTVAHSGARPLRVAKVRARVDRFRRLAQHKTRVAEAYQETVVRVSAITEATAKLKKARFTGTRVAQDVPE